MGLYRIAAFVFAAIIGLVIGYVGIAVKMKASKEAAELTLLNAEQEATNLRGQAEREADLIVKEAMRETSSLKKKHFWRQKKKPENIVKRLMQNLSLSVKS